MYSLATMAQYALIALVIYIVIRLIMALMDPKVRRIMAQARTDIARGVREAVARRRAQKQNRPRKN